MNAYGDFFSKKNVLVMRYVKGSKFLQIYVYRNTFLKYKNNVFFFGMLATRIRVFLYSNIILLLGEGMVTQHCTDKALDTLAAFNTNSVNRLIYQQ
jgi:hypothetical protein